MLNGYFIMRAEVKKMQPICSAQIRNTFVITKFIGLGNLIDQP